MRNLPQGGVGRNKFFFTTHRNFLPRPLEPEGGAMSARHKRNKGHLPPFVPLIRTTLASPAWKQLSFGARSLYVVLVSDDVAVMEICVVICWDPTYPKSVKTDFQLCSTGCA